MKLNEGIIACRSSVGRERESTFVPFQSCMKGIAMQKAANQLRVFFFGSPINRLLFPLVIFVMICHTGWVFSILLFAMFFFHVIFVIFAIISIVCHYIQRKFYLYWATRWKDVVALYYCDTVSHVCLWNTLIKRENKNNKNIVTDVFSADGKRSFQQIEVINKQNEYQNIRTAKITTKTLQPKHIFSWISTNTFNVSATVFV